MIRFSCPTCGATIVVSADKTGNELGCLNCGQQIQIPSSLAEVPRPTAHLHKIEEAAIFLRQRRVATQAEYDALDAQEKQSSFTVAGIESKAILEKVRDTLADNLEKGIDERQ